MQPIGVIKFVDPVSMERLKTMHTGSLLTRLQNLRSLDIDFEHSDWDENELKHNMATGQIVFKETELWKTAFSEVKELLAQREHIPRGSKEKRREAAKNKHR